MIRVFCPSCKTPFDVDKSLTGQKGLCPTCGVKFIISTQTTAALNSDSLVTQPMKEAPKSVEKPPWSGTVTGTAESAPAASVASGTEVATAVLEASEASETNARPSLRSFGIALTLAAATAAGYWLLYKGKVPESRWLDFSGELHPLMVHFPAALIPVILLLHFLGGKGVVADRNIRILLWVNFLAACGGILAGFVSSMSHGAKEDLRLHTLFGLATAVLSFFTLVFHILRVRPFYLLNLFLAMGAVFGAGHFGSNVSHGDISKKFPWRPLEKPAATPAAKAGETGKPSPSSTESHAVVDQVILPILQARCVSCHGAEKSKGDLRLDSFQAMMLAGEGGKPSVIPGNATQSESLVRILLPLDHEDHMPPDKKPNVSQMTPDEIEVFTWWVQSGANAKLGMEDLGIPGGISQKMKQVVAALPKK